VLRDYLPPALRGVMVAAFLAAFMSTLGTQLNWGVSYLVNDLYRRFAVRGRSEKHYVAAGRIFTIVLVLVSSYVASELHSVGQGWEIVLNLGIGTGAVYILRWYWWRINAWSEIVAMSVAAIVTVVLSRVKFAGTEPIVFAKTALITASCTTVAWVIATLLTPSEPEQKLLEFYRRVHPTVHGWRKIAALAPDMAPVSDLKNNAFDWVLGCLLVYCSLFGIGKIIFGQPVFGILLLALAALCGYLIFWDLSQRGWESLSGVAPKTVDLEAVATENRN
jgi:solute:Na+ symporter, SSS family